MRAIIGDFGHLSVILSFVAAIVAAFSYYKFSTTDDLSWKKYARAVFFVHSAAVVLVVIALFTIIYNHYYEFHYAWSHSSNFLPVHYMISCFWEGQEGSFLLWVFWHVVIGIFLLRSLGKWEGPVMTVFMLVQAFLNSMILGVVLLEAKIGSSPFISMADAMPEAPIFQSNPDFVPLDGTGLNPLLQNYWMVIHPPTLFLGFALTLVPFAFAMAGLWKNDFSSWIPKVQIWTLIGVFVLGLGIMMGAYWAYETLNFGGYWNWDPVENAVYVPWLTLVAAAHAMLIFRKKGIALKSVYVLVVISFVLILYSTFLTRSGILGNASVHSFTDLGLSGQLLIYLAAFVLLAALLMLIKWDKLPNGELDTSWRGSEFWIFLAIGLLCLAGFQVIMGTSLPVFNEIKGLFGEKGKLAPPADQIGFYSRFQIWMAIIITAAGGLGQYLWWNKLDNKQSSKFIGSASFVFTILFVISAGLIAYFEVSSGFLAEKLQSNTKPLRMWVGLLSYVLLLAASLFGLFFSSKVFWKLFKKQGKQVGGSLAHIGLAMMLIGMLFSAGYSKVISINQSGLLYSKEFPDEMNLENVLLWRGKSLQMNKYSLNYAGPRIETTDGDFIDRDGYWLDKDLHVAVSKTSAIETPDTLSVYPENTYYEINYNEGEGGDNFTLYPRAQANPNMGLLASPDIRHLFSKDLYTYIASIPDPDQEVEWGDTTEMVLQLRDTSYLNDFVTILDSVKRVTDLPGANLQANDIAIQAYLTVYGNNMDYQAKPLMLISRDGAYSAPFVVDDLGLKISLLNIDPLKGEFSFGVNTSQRDYVILKVIEKPWINLLWLGTIVCLVGVGIAVVARQKQA